MYFTVQHTKHKRNTAKHSQGITAPFTMTLISQTSFRINAKRLLYTVLKASEEKIPEETCMFHKTLSSKKRFITYRVFQKEFAILR
jgi:hypothetical protein